MAKFIQVKVEQRGITQTFGQGDKVLINVDQIVSVTKYRKTSNQHLLTLSNSESYLVDFDNPENAEHSSMFLIVASSAAVPEAKSPQQPIKERNTGVGRVVSEKPEGGTLVSKGIVRSIDEQKIATAKEEKAKAESKEAVKDIAEGIKDEATPKSKAAPRKRGRGKASK